ncbi:MAG: hypothetical protein FJ387_17425 [Verrucomicrobia bacterium]|nr:hypothetical protein [Verrucomicrobiota bacterium]
MTSNARNTARVGRLEASGDVGGLGRVARWAGVAGWMLAGAVASQAEPVLRLTGFDAEGVLGWVNAPVPGVCSVEVAGALEGPWLPGPNAFATGSTGWITVPQEGSGRRFYRLRAVEVAATASGFANLVHSYGLLETMAGTGAGQVDGVSYWQSWFEGWPATWVALSRPHFAMADRAGNVYIADKNSHSVLRVEPDGTIHTHAGTHEGGYAGEGPAAATSLALQSPNGLWVHADGTVYILDTGNGRVRRVTPAGVMTTVCWATADGSALGGGRGLWVREDGGLVYFCAETRIRSWTPASGLRTVASGFAELGTLFVEANGDLIVCDRGAHLVYRVRPTGTRTVLAGNGTPSGGGDGWPGVATGLDGVRSAWPVPTGGYLLLTHDGCQLWYLDGGGTVRLLLHGGRGRTHGGDGQFFYTPEPTISEGRSVTMAYDGSILVCESDYGYVRRIRFQRLPP